MPKSGHIKHVEQGHEKPEDVDFEHGKNERLTQGEHGEHGGHLAEVEVKDQALEKVDQELAQEIMDGARDNTRLLDDFLDNPDIIDDHENNPTHKVPDFKFHTEKDEFRDSELPIEDIPNISTVLIVKLGQRAGQSSINIARRSRRTILGPTRKMSRTTLT